jgi:MoaA/NifB/PqqE/SkfB family radical SAM enzyme
LRGTPPQKAIAIDGASRNIRFEKSLEELKMREFARLLRQYCKSCKYSGLR